MTDLITRLREESAAALADDYPDTADLLSEAAANITELVEVLEAVRAQFDFYASEHRKAEKHDKAATNEKFAFLCSQALARVRTQEPTP